MKAMVERTKLLFFNSDFMSLHDEGGHPAITSFRDFESSQAARVIIYIFTKNDTVHFIPKICLITPNIWQNQNSRPSGGGVASKKVKQKNTV